MFKIKWLGLQLFAGEGAGNAGTAGGEGGGEGAATGDNNTADAGQNRLLELGVPASKLRKSRAQKSDAAALPKGTVKTEAELKQQAETGQAAAAENTNNNPAPARMSWEEIMADPEYNKQMQATVQARLRTAKDAEEKLTKLNPALELISRKYGLDSDHFDIDAITKAISEDANYYETRALELGIPVEAAMKIDQLEREAARRQREESRTLEEQKLQEHFAKLQQQGQAMKATFPTFDLASELRNPAFARMTAPGVGISVEDAYYAVHRNEIQTAAMQATAQKTAQEISKKIQSGQRRPDEAGTSGMAASVTTFDYSKATKEQREELKKQIRAAAARGEKIYPGSR